MLKYTPDIGLLKALIAMNDGKTSVIVTPPDQQVVAWVHNQGYRVTLVAGTAEIRPGDVMDVPLHPLTF
ncbi:hypothetical protein [Asanoa iriomotensis]|uniref:Uncharacterized protein n=1 Tax=Asanoa iriomotensis TaxID=234613 RepID=A0ABQ4C0F5_9ACTN|nr:hypothetical protein [Asanoa iriomotensis]GIF55780.1 hypothetical protein Air01nite_18750 [Asanoa iriomotensis]